MGKYGTRETDTLTQRRAGAIKCGTWEGEGSAATSEGAELGAPRHIDSIRAETTCRALRSFRVVPSFAIDGHHVDLLALIGALDRVILAADAAYRAGARGGDPPSG